VSTNAATQSRDPRQQMDAAVEQYLRVTGTPGVCVAVYYPECFGTTGLVRPYGLASLHPVLGVQAETVFGLGSVTKVFTSILLACAVEKGYVNLGDRAIDYLSGQYGAQGSQVFDTIQLLNLATHTSGIPMQPAAAGPGGEQLFTDEAPSSDLLQYWAQYSGPKVPACWEYSNTAFVTLGFALTAMFPGLSNNEYNKLLHDYVTGPLGLSHTGAIPDEALFAQGYVRKEDGPTAPAKIVAADLKSNGIDLLKLLKAYLQVAPVNDLLSKALPLTIERHGVYDICGKTGKNMTMGLAWQIYDRGGFKLCTKDGSTAAGGFSCDVQVSPNAKFGIAVLTNQTWEKKDKGSLNPSGLATRILEILAPQLAPDKQS
jgi:beta-lactamase class C